MGLLVVFSGCLFDTREATPPGGGESSSWQVPTVPSRVFLNLESGLEERTGTNYTRSLNTVFTFVPLPQDEQNPTLAGKFVNWNVTVENAVVDRIVSESSEITVTFDNITQIRDQNPFADFQVHYMLTIVSNTVPRDTTDYRGTAQFDMQDGSKGWQLIRWEDIQPDSGFATWGFLRGTLRP